MRGISCAGEVSRLDLNAAHAGCTEQSELHRMHNCRLVGYDGFAVQGGTNVAKHMQLPWMA